MAASPRSRSKAASAARAYVAEVTRVWRHAIDAAASGARYSVQPGWNAMLGRWLRASSRRWAPTTGPGGEGRTSRETSPSPCPSASASPSARCNTGGRACRCWASTPRWPSTRPWTPWCWRGDLLAPQRIQVRRLAGTRARPGRRRQDRGAGHDAAHQHRGRTAHPAPPVRTGRIRGRGRRRLGAGRAGAPARGAARAPGLRHRPPRECLQPRGAGRMGAAGRRHLGAAAGAVARRHGPHQPARRSCAGRCRPGGDGSLRLRPHAVGVLGAPFHGAPPPAEEGRMRLPLPRRRRRPAAGHQRRRTLPGAERHPDPVGGAAVPAGHRPGAGGGRRAPAAVVAVQPWLRAGARRLRRRAQPPQPVGEGMEHLRAAGLPGALVDGFARQRPGMVEVAA